MTDKDKEDNNQHPTDASVEVVAYDHIKIVDDQTGKELVNKRG